MHLPSLRLERPVGLKEQQRRWFQFSRPGTIGMITQTRPQNLRTNNYRQEPTCKGKTEYPSTEHEPKWEKHSALCKNGTSLQRANAHAAIPSKLSTIFSQNIHKVPTAPTKTLGNATRQPESGSPTGLTRYDDDDKSSGTKGPQMNQSYLLPTITTSKLASQDTQ